MLIQRHEQTEREPKLRRGAGLFSGGAVAILAVCCGGHLLVLGLLGGVALGSVLGIAAGALAAVLLVAGTVVLRRRRSDTACTALPRSRASR